MANMDAPNNDFDNAASNSAEQQEEPVVPVRGKVDPAWDHIAFKKDGKATSYTCLYCGHTFYGGGITRMKKHLARISGDIRFCKKVPDDVAYRMKKALESISATKKRAELNKAYDDPIEDNVVEVEPSECAPLNTPCPSTQNKGKRKSNEEIGSYFAPRTTPGSQPTIRSVLATKEAVHKAHMAIARWLYDACIPFNATQSPYFQDAADAIASIGPGFKVPSYHDVRVNLLEDCKKECQLLVESHRASWAKSGCTIMADGWTDLRQRTLINFLVYCPDGITFVKSVDASDVVKTSQTLCNLFLEVIEWVGPSNVVHIVTDNAANYVAAGRLINEKYDNIFWSPCVAHYLNLLLKDICSMPHVSDLASKASKVTIFVYNHMVFLSWLRKRIGWNEIVRPGVTRFATTFITLKSIHNRQNDLQALVVDTHFTSHKLAKTSAGKTVRSIILDQAFWDQCDRVTTLVAPLVHLLRIVDGDEKPSMGYVYEGMQRAKNAIKVILGNKKHLYKPYTNIIKARWDKHLKRDLHAAAYFLNPAFLYDDKFQEKNRIMDSLLRIFSVPSFDINLTHAINEINLYRNKKDSFGTDNAKKVAKTILPDQWWKFFGSSAPILQKLAMRLLCQTSSSSGCERNWSLFERIHTKRRNRLEHKRLNDLVYVTYNLRLKKRLNSNKRSFDPIDYESIDNVDVWVTEDETTPEFGVDDIDDLIHHTQRANEGEENLDQPMGMELGHGSNDASASTGSLEDANILAYAGVDLNDCYDN